MNNHIILVDKKEGISSYFVIKMIKKLYHTNKVGHCGTLDPFATGLMILLSGKMTKKSNEFLKLDKVYEAEMKLGFTSTTGDPEGEITEVGSVIPEMTDIQKVLDFFTGEISQTVPKFSAVKINGERAYKLARKGTDFETPTRKITIYKIELLDYSYPTLKIRCHVSSGTYIRTLAEDIGKALGTSAYLTALRRTQIDNYHIEDAKKVVL